VTRQYKPIRFTNCALESLPNQRDQVIYKDTQLSQLGLLVGARTQSFFIQANYQCRQIRHSLGKFPYMAVEKTRRRGLKVLCKIFDGEDPNAARRTEIELSRFTLANTLDLYIKTHNELKERTIYDYKG